MNITVSVITYNAAATLGACLESILTQAPFGGECEVLVVDGCSSDATQNIARRYGERVRIVENPGRTIASNRNAAIREARHDYIAFTDADCVVPPGWLSILSRGFESIKKDNENLAAVGGCNTAPVDGGLFQKALGMARGSVFGGTGSVQGRIHSKQRSVGSLACLNVLYDKLLLIDVGGFDENLKNMCEDADINYRLRMKGKSLYVLPGVSVGHCSRQGYLSWCANMYAYGVGRGRLIRKHKTLFSAAYVLPLLLIPLLVSGSVLVGVSKWFLAVWLYVPLMVVAGCSSALAKKSPLGFLVGVILMGSHLSYSVGIWYGLIAGYVGGYQSDSSRNN